MIGLLLSLTLKRKAVVTITQPTFTTGEQKPHVPSRLLASSLTADKLPSVTLREVGLNNAACVATAGFRNAGMATLRSKSATKVGLRYECVLQRNLAVSTVPAAQRRPSYVGKRLLLVSACGLGGDPEDWGKAQFSYKERGLQSLHRSTLSLAVKIHRFATSLDGGAEDGISFAERDCLNVLRQQLVHGNEAVVPLNLTAAAEPHRVVRSANKQPGTGKRRWFGLNSAQRSTGSQSTSTSSTAVRCLPPFAQTQKFCLTCLFSAWGRVSVFVGNKTDEKGSQG